MTTSERAIMLEVWLHAGSQQEQQTLQAQVAAFNARQYRIRVNAVILPEEDYEARIQDAAARRRLPDIIEVKGSRLARYAWQSYLRPLDKLLTDETHEKLLPQALAANSYDGRLYALPTHLQMPVLYVRRDLLAESRVDIPVRPWNVREFSRVLRALADHDQDGRVLNIALDHDPLLLTELLTPALRSAGGDLLTQHQGLHVRGILDSTKNIRTLSTLAGWQRQGLLSISMADQQTGDDFYRGTAAVSWAPMSMGRQYRQRWQDKMTVLPLPDFGHGSRLSLAGWGWALTRDSRQPQAAMHFLEFILEDERISEISRAAYSLPSSQSVLANWPSNGRQGPDEEIGLLRRGGLPLFSRIPPTPAYPLIQRAFARTVKEILLAGEDVRISLKSLAQDLERKTAGFRGS